VGLAQEDGGAAGGDHEHAATGAEVFVVEVDAHDGVGAQGFGAFLHFAQGDVLGVAQFVFVGGGASAHDVADAGEDVFEDIGAQYGLARDDAFVLDDGFPFDAVCGGNDHGHLLIGEWSAGFDVGVVRPLMVNDAAALKLHRAACHLRARSRAIMGEGAGQRAMRARREALYPRRCRS